MINEFTGTISGPTSKFFTLNIALEDSSLVKKPLDSIPYKYFPIVAKIEQFLDLQTMPFEEAIGGMKVYEEWIVRLLGNNNNTDGQLLGEQRARI